MIAPTSAASAAAQPADLFSQGDPNSLGQDAFLKLLITQIQMQDPLEPMAADDYIAQLAQFSSVEQLQSANLQLAVLNHLQGVVQALLLIGRTITTGEDGITGVVDGVTFEDGQPMLLVGGEQVDPGDVTAVS